MGVARVITSGFEAKQKILDGMAELEAAVESTLGPHGHTVILDNGGLVPKITKDGVSTSKFIDFSDKYKRIGAALIKEVTSKVEVECGDGTTTSAIIAKNLTFNATKYQKQGFDTKEMRSGMDAASKYAIDYLNKNVKEIQGIEDIKKIANVSSNGNDEIVENVAKAFGLIGDGGMVTIAVSNEDNTHVEFNEGVSYDNGFAHGNFVNSRKNTAEIDNACVLLFEETLSKWDEQWDYTIASLSSNKERHLLVLAQAYSDEFKAACFSAMRESNVDSTQIILAYCPGAEYTRIHMVERCEDLMAMLNINLSEARTYKVDMLDTLNPVISHATLKIRETLMQLNDTYTSKEVLDKHIAAVKAYLEEVQSGVADPDTIQLVKERLATMTGGIATIYIAALTKPALEEKYDSYEDTVNAVKSAITYGYLPGGGAALLCAAQQIDRKITLFDDFTPSEIQGWKVVSETLQAPFKLLVTSDVGDMKVSEIFNEVLKAGFGSGYNVTTHRVEKDITQDIIDPLNVEVNAIKYSNAMVGNFISADYIVTNEVDNVRVKPNDEVMNGFN